MAYIGPAPNPGQNREVDDISSGFNGGTASFTLQVNGQNVSPGSANAIIVSLGGVVQNPGTDYTVAASTITFTTNPASGLSFFGLVLGQQVDTQSLADGTSPTMSAPTITGDLSIADKIVHTGDTNTAIRFPATDEITFETSGSERLRINSSGKLLGGNYFTSQQIGAVTAPVQVQGTSADTSALSLFRYSNDTGGSRITLGKGRGTSGGAADKPQENDTVGTIHFHVANNNDLVNGNVAAIDAQMDGAVGGGDTPGRIRFLTSPDGSSTLSERMRILSSGKILANRTTEFTTSPSGGDAVDYQFEQLTSDGYTLGVHCDQTLQRGMAIYYTPSKSPEPSFIFKVGTSFKTIIRADGDLENANNSYGSISDVSMKENIVDANSQWNDIKNIKIRNYNFKESTGQQTHTQIGVIAQELETVSPKLVRESEDGMKTVSYSLLYMKAVKALQEAQARIEILETKVAALEAA